jgi:hypothetical protein
MDLKRASHGEVTSRGVMDRFGGNPKLGLSSEWLEARVGGLDGWILSGAEGVLNLLDPWAVVTNSGKDARRPERRGCTGASNWWRLPWQAHWRSPDGLRWLTGGVVKVPRHVAQGREMANSGEPIRSSRSTGGYDGHSRIVAGVHPWCDISYPSVLSNCARHESPWRVRIRVHDRRLWVIWNWRSDPDTVPLKTWFRAPDRQICSAQILDFRIRDC